MSKDIIRGVVLKPIPGFGYSIGEVAEFESEGHEWLLEGDYLGLGSELEKDEDFVETKETEVKPKKDEGKSIKEDSGN